MYNYYKFTNRKTTTINIKTLIYKALIYVSCSP